MEDFKIDTDALKKAAGEYEKQLENLETIKLKIDRILFSLKYSGWDSEAGEACMKKFDDKLAKEIDKYIKVVNFLDGVLSGSQIQFESLIEEANKLKFIG